MSLLCIPFLTMTAETAPADVTFRAEVRPFSDSDVDYDYPTIVRDDHGVLLCVNEFAFQGPILLNNLVTLRSDDHGGSWKNRSYILPPATTDAPRALLAPLLANRRNTIAVAWTERMEDPDGGAPAYALRATTTEDGGRTYSAATPIGSTSFGTQVQLVALAPTESGFAVVVTSRDDFTSPFLVSVFESVSPFTVWDLTFVLPDSASSIGGVDVWSGSERTLLAVALDQQIDVYERCPTGAWARLSSLETQNRAYDVQVVDDPVSGASMLAWVDYRIPSVAHAALTSMVGGDTWMALGDLVAGALDDYLLPKLTVGNDGVFHLLLHRTADRFAGPFDIVYANTTIGHEWSVSSSPLNNPTRPIPLGRGAEIIGGESIDVVWEDAPFATNAGVRFRTTASVARVNMLTETLPVVPLPNPTRGVGSVSFRSPKVGQATLRLFGVSGRLVGTWRLGSVEAATYYVDWADPSLGSGVYIWQVDVIGSEGRYRGRGRQVVAR